MTKLSLSLLLALVFCGIDSVAAANSDAAIEAKCLAQIRKNYEEPKEVKLDRDYQSMKLKASLFVESDGKVISADLQRKSERIYLPEPGQTKAKAPERSYIGLSTPENTKAAEDAFVSALKRSSPLPVAGSSYSGPYSIWVEYSPGAKTKWIFRLGPPPQQRPILRKR